MQVYIRIFLVFIHIYWNICMIPVINQLWPAGPADTRMHDRPARPTAFCWNQKYPRICGEKPASRRSTAGWIGSPPHMQGKGGGPRAYQCPWRITPAYAGKSHLHRKSLPAAGDHPRMCGEKSVIIDPVMLWSGSPPHVRGKGRRRVRQAGRAGITPAYAGKSSPFSAASRMARNHPPHMRG